MGLLNTILDPILGLLTLLLFPNNYMNSGKGTQTYTLSRINYVGKVATVAGVSRQQYVLMLRAFLRTTQGNSAQQFYSLIQQAMLSTSAPMNHGRSQDNYNISVEIVYIPDPSKTTVLANGSDAIMFTSLPIPSHWKTLQMGEFGASNEFDWEEESFEATFYPPGKYLITISAPGFAEQSWTVDAIEDPNPPEETGE